MADARQLAYLGALGIDVYVRRDLPDDAAVAVQPAATTGASIAISTMDPDSELPTGGAAPPSRPPVPGPEATLDWEPLREMVSACTRCDLHATRTQTVFGVGNRAARWMFIGEAPGADEDKQGEPFVGRAGQLLNSMLRAIGLGREDVYIANVLKCRPPGNRDPRPGEAAGCRGYLERQIELIDPVLIVAVGRIAAQSLLETDLPLARLRGRVHALGPRGRPLLVTYHPAYLLRTPSEKRKAWQDLVLARSIFARLQGGERATS